MKILKLFLFLTLFVVEATAQGVGGIAVGGGVRGRANNYVPDPPPDGCVGFDYTDTDYTGARAQSGSAGETLCIDDARFGGGFDFAVADPYGNGDDGALVLSASGGGFWVRDFAIGTLGDPIQMKWSEDYVQNANLTTFFTNMATSVPGNSIYMVANTITAVDTVLSDYISWSNTYGIKNFYLYEDTDTLNIKHTGTGNANLLWEFDNYDNVVIGQATTGGSNTYITFVGTHPGLGTGDANETPGLIDFGLTGSYTGAYLLSFAANVHHAPRRGFNHTGSQTIGGSTSRVDSMYIKGRFIGGGLRNNGGVAIAHMDSVIQMDPFNAVMGWDGVVAGTSGRDYGCYDDNNKQNRRGGDTGQFFDKLTGVLVLEYGGPNANIFESRNIGSASDPFTVYFKDIGASGPTSMTGLTAGVASKTSAQYTVMKHDPMTEQGVTRYIKIVELAPSYGNGWRAGPIASGCAPGNATNNNFQGGINNTVWRTEASSDGQNDPYFTTKMHATIDMSTAWFSASATSGYGGTSNSGGDCPVGGCDRTWNHTLIAASGASLPGEWTLGDTSTATSIDPYANPDNGSFYRLSMSLSTNMNCADNTIIDANVDNQITINAACTGSTLTRVTLPSTATIVANAGFTCSGVGSIGSGTYDMSVLNDRTTLGATGTDPYTICTP